MDFLNCLETCYSDRAQIIDIGKSVEGKPLRVIKIGRNKNQNGTLNPAVWIDGGIHAREWISPAAVEYIVYELVERFDITENKEIVENFDIYVLPIMNPDGYVLG